MVHVRVVQKFPCPGLLQSLAPVDIYANSSRRCRQWGGEIVSTSITPPRHTVEWATVVCLSVYHSDHLKSRGCWFSVFAIQATFCTLGGLAACKVFPSYKLTQHFEIFPCLLWTLQTFWRITHNTAQGQEAMWSGGWLHHSMTKNVNIGLLII